MGKSKYAGIIETLPRSLGTDPDFQEKVNAIKRQILEPPSDSTTPEDRQELSGEALEDLLLEVKALQSVINDALIHSLGGKLQAYRLAKIYRDIRIMKSAFEDQEKVTNVLLEAYKQLLVDQYEVEGISSLKLDNGSSIRTQPEPHAQVTDKDANRKWAIENGLENSLSLPWQTVNALTKEALLQGNEPPDGVTAVSITKVVYTK